MNGGQGTRVIGEAFIRAYCAQVPGVVPLRHSQSHVPQHLPYGLQRNPSITTWKAAVDQQAENEGRFKRGVGH
jgi:hypothetical protein